MILSDFLQSRFAVPGAAGNFNAQRCVAEESPREKFRNANTGPPREGLLIFALVRGTGIINQVPWNAV